MVIGSEEMNNNKLKKNKKLTLKIFIIVILFVTLGGLLIETKTGFFSTVTRKFLNSLGIYTEGVKEVEFESDDFSSGAGGSYHIKKSADWTALSTATIHFDVETTVQSHYLHRDVVFVFDTSSSMLGLRMAEVREEGNELVPKILEDKDSRIAFITFDKDAKLITDFTNDERMLLDEINKLEANTVDGTTNYYDGLKKAEEILEGYTQKDDTELVVLFLTDGLPNVNTPNQIAEYQKLKIKYPFMRVCGIQYEMGETIMSQIKEISDEQFEAHLNDLHNAMFDAAFSPMAYDTFEITDYIDNDYYTVEDDTKIKTTKGTATLQVEGGKQKVVWHFNKGELHSGNEVEMDIDVKINNNLKEKPGYYPTNENVEVKSTIDGKNNNTTFSNTPILQHGYKVKYESNMPSGCSSSFSKEETHYAFESVKIEGENLTCKDYLFKGWKVKEAVQMVNDETFVMPQNDVIVRSLWTNFGLQKSMEGTINEKLTLYRAVAKQAVPDNEKSEFTGSSGINFNQNSSDTNGKGVYTIADTLGERYPIHYFRGEVNNNNVIFGGFCWQIVRTTETGGVKLIYNGTPLNNQCPEGRTNDERIIKKAAFNKNYNSPAYVGYKYGTAYTYKEKVMDITGLTTGHSKTITGGMTETNYWYSDTVTYDPVTGMYTLENPTQKFWSDTYRENQFKYTCLSDIETSCSPVYYVIATANSSMSKTELKNGETADEVGSAKIIYGNDVTYEDGTYKLTNTFEGLVGSAQTEYQKIAGANGYHYTCFSDKDTCSTVSYIYYAESITNSGIPQISAYYIDLENGKKIDEALKEMTTESDNSTPSNIMTEIDKWYEENLKGTYGSMLEDTIWCNDRTISDYGGLDKDGDGVSKSLYFSPYARRNSQPSLTCSNPNDRFTVSGEVGNGKLTNPVGTITMDEARYAGAYSTTTNKTYYLYTNGSYWLASPYNFYHSGASEFFVHSNGSLYYNYVYTSSYGVRPAVSLKPGTLYSSGDGTPEQPYIVDLQDY